MRKYYRIMLGEKSKYAEDCLKGSFIGVDFFADTDLTGKLPNNWRDFNQQFIPIYLKKRPEKSKIAAGLACGATWTVAKGVLKGDLVICPNGVRSYLVGEVQGDYSYHAGEILPHRRIVKWYPKPIERDDMSQELKFSTGSVGTVSDITKYAAEIEKLIGGNQPPTIISTDETVEDPSDFAMEKHLEDFLVQNWKQTELGKRYDIFEEDGKLQGKQYSTEVGIIDILAISKDRKELLVIELKKGRTGDTVVGQTLRYMGYIQSLAEKGQTVKGLIIAREEDPRIKWALAATQNIEFLKYQISFKLVK